MPFRPKYTITPKIARCLMRIEAARQSIQSLPFRPSLLASLRESARRTSTHYSTRIEGNRLTQDEVVRVLERHERFPGRERDEHEVLGYYAALEKMESLAAAGGSVTERHIQQLHALVMSGGRTKVKPSHFRDGQNVIRDGRTGRIVYLPPEAQDVPRLMRDLTVWMKTSAEQELPCPLRAGIVHYQFATIHPYYDGNGRTARLLTTLILHLGGYDLKGLYSLEEYYARKLGAYYRALTIGPSHNYYLGRAKADITPWVDYFCAGLADSFENVRRNAENSAAGADLSPLLRKLNLRQRQLLGLFRDNETITSRDVEQMFEISQRMARKLLGQWVAVGFLMIANPARKSRNYALAEKYR